MAIEEGIVGILRADSAVAALVVQRIYAVKLPQDVAYPAISYFMVSDFRTVSHDGPTGYAQPRLQVDCWAIGYTQARSLATAVREALEGFIGTEGDVVIRGIELDSGTDFYDEDAKLFRRSQDFFIRYREAA